MGGVQKSAKYRQNAEGAIMQLAPEFGAYSPLNLFTNTLVLEGSMIYIYIYYTLALKLSLRIPAKVCAIVTLGPLGGVASY